MPLGPAPPTVGEPAPLFSLPSLLGSTVELSAYRGRRNVIVWFSRGQGIIRHRLVVGPIETVPGAAALAALTRVHCDEALPA